MKNLSEKVKIIFQCIMDTKKNLLQILGSQGQVGLYILKEIKGELLGETGAQFIPICHNDLCAFIWAICPTTICLSSHAELLSSILFPEIKSTYSGKCILMSPLLGKLSRVIFLADLSIALFCTLLHLFYSYYLVLQ